MIERDVQHFLFVGFEQQSRLAIPNYTPRDWFECDLFSVTKAHYFREYEVKLTISDFRADVKKRDKHQRLAAGDPRGPVQFNYVAPAGMIDHNELPKWAGLIELVVKENRLRKKLVRAHKSIKGPRLHNTKIDERIIEHARSVCYWRYWHERARYTEALKKQRTEAA